jgi:intracellular sulfur oxidation DsrE/DsrF family protein
MKTTSRVKIVALVFSVSFLFLMVGNSLGQGNEALKDLKSVKTIFDVRAGNPKSVALFLNLIHETYTSKTIRSITKKPNFVVVFIGPSVKLLSKNREGFPAEDHKIIDGIAEKISEMAKDGITLEICLVAARIFDVAPESVFPEIMHVENGWLSLIGYQAKGYSLVPVY